MRTLLRVIRGVGVMLAVALGAAACGTSTRVAQPALTTVPATTTTTVGATTVAPVAPVARATTTTAPPPPEPVSTTIATLTAATPASAVAGGPAVAKVPASWYKSPSVLPVIATQPGWIEVREAQRPNESTAWIPASAATLSTTPYYLVLSLGSEHLTVYRVGYPVMSFPTGIGTPGDPTPSGRFFVAMKVAAPSAGYGPFVLATSAHSDTITDWEQSGDAVIAIHGPISGSADQAIGTTGARISHGCIRLHDADLAQLAGIPAGTPLDIVA